MFVCVSVLVRVGLIVEVMVCSVFVMFMMVVCFLGLIIVVMKVVCGVWFMLFKLVWMKSRIIVRIRFEGVGKSRMVSDDGIWVKIIVLMRLR